jgi:molybdopterin synthase catalytic subunit
MDLDIQIKENALDISSCVDWVMSPQSGGIDVFIGTVRDVTKGKQW